MKTLLIVCILLVSTVAFAGDVYKGQSLAVDAPSRRAIVITPSDVTPLLNVPRALYVGGTGDVTVILADDSVSTLFVSVSGILPIMVKQVMSTGTTATNIVAFY